MKKVSNLIIGSLFTLFLLLFSSGQIKKSSDFLIEDISDTYIKCYTIYGYVDKESNRAYRNHFNVEETENIKYRIQLNHFYYLGYIDLYDLNVFLRRGNVLIDNKIHYQNIKCCYPSTRIEGGFASPKELGRGEYTVCISLFGSILKCNDFTIY